MFRRFTDQFIFVIIINVVIFVILGGYALWSLNSLKNINQRSKLISGTLILNVIKFKNYFDNNYVDSISLEQNLISSDIFKKDFSERVSKKEEIISALSFFPGDFKKGGGISAEEHNFAKNLETQLIDLTVSSRDQDSSLENLIKLKETGSDIKSGLQEIGEKTKNTDKLLSQILLAVGSLEGINFDHFQNAQNKSAKNIFIILTVFSFISIGIMIATVLTIASGLNAILEGIKKFSKNEYNYRIPLKSQNELGLIANYLNTAIINIEKMDELKTSFISIASHQIRTPLAATRWFSEMLLSGDAGPLNQFQKEFAEELHNGILRISEIVNTLLALSRIEAGKLVMQPVSTDVILLTENIVASFAPQLQTKELKIEFLPAPPIPVIQIDPNLLREAVSNLIANSIQYTEAGGIIKVKVSKLGNDIQYSVEDNGIGIPENQKSQLFEKFFRADNARLKVPDGLGLGLNLIKRLIELWGGKIWFESEVGKGTTFYFTIPYIKEI
ncbi:MAG: HAMP domain-containing histidine kinase [Parcubacteria group bacterium]|nr:HAMP domain-containing histidine kinase [Parcubacteria group bacterium]